MIEWFTNHSLLLLLAAATITSICWLFQANGRLNFKSWQVVTLGVAHTCLGVLAVKAFAIIEGFGDLSVVGNMSLFGGMALLPIFYGTLARKGHRDTRDVFDVLTMSLVMTLFFARINCIIPFSAAHSNKTGRLPRQTALFTLMRFVVTTCPTAPSRRSSWRRAGGCP